MGFSFSDVGDLFKGAANAATFGATQGVIGGPNPWDPGQDSRNAGKKLSREAIAGYDALKPPSLESLQIDPSKLTMYQNGTPYGDVGARYLENAGKQLEAGGYGSSAAAGAKDAYNTMDPQGRNVQNQARQYFSDIMKNGGHDAASDAYYEKQRSDAEQAGRAQREAGMQQLAAQGRQSGGAGVLNQLMASRDAAANANAAALGAASMAQGRRDEAGQQVGNIGQNLAGQSLAQAQGQNAFALNKAQAQDAMKANLGDWLGKYGSQAAGIEQTGQDSNVARQNAVQDQNTGLLNQNTLRNSDLIQQDYQNQFNKTAAQGNARLGAATNTFTNANTGPGAFDFAQGAANLMKAYGGMQNGGQAKKKNDFGMDI